MYQIDKKISIAENDGHLRQQVNLPLSGKITVAPEFTLSLGNVLI